MWYDFFWNVVFFLLRNCLMQLYNILVYWQKSIIIPWYKIDKHVFMAVLKFSKDELKLPSYF